MATKPSAGKSVSQETSILRKIKDMVKTDAKVYFILWKYAPQLLTDGERFKTFDDLKANYKTFTDGMTETSCENLTCPTNPTSINVSYSPT